MADSTNTIRAPLTPVHDQRPHVVKIKVFWKTVKPKWAATDIADYRTAAPDIAAAIQKAGTRHTCDKFVLSVLIRYASTHGLPLKITTGAGVFRNMLPYDASLDKFESSAAGYGVMALPHFTAHDVKNNAKVLAGRANLQLGSLLVEDTTLNGHVQLVTKADAKAIHIKQGNFPSDMTAAGDRFMGKVKSWFTGVNDSSVPGSPDYLGVPIQDGSYQCDAHGAWHYKNETLNRADDSVVTKMNRFMDWDFDGFSA